MKRGNMSRNSVRRRRRRTQAEYQSIGEARASQGSAGEKRPSAGVGAHEGGGGQSGGGRARLADDAKSSASAPTDALPDVGEGVGGRLSGQAGLTLMRYPTMEHHLSEEFM